MWAFVVGFVFSDRIDWQLNSFRESVEDDSPDGVKLSIQVANGPDVLSRRTVMSIIKRGVLSDPKCRWITPGDRAWTLGLEKLAEMLPSSDRFGFLHGVASIEPEYEEEKQLMPPDNIPHYWGNAVFFITPKSLQYQPSIAMPPLMIADSLERFKKKHPNAAKTAFIMMSFEKTKAHTKIVEAIRESLARHDITGLRADAKEFHDDLFYNVLTYMHGCAFGGTVFERIKSEEFNPNVGLEVGYMLALGKKVCLLKDDTLDKLQSDLIGKLYKPFDVQDPEGTIPSQLDAWLEDRELVNSVSDDPVKQDGGPTTDVLREGLRCTEFMSYLDDWEILSIAKAVLIEESPNLTWQPSSGFSLVSKGFIESVPATEAFNHPFTGQPVTFVFPANVWRYLVDGREWWLYRALERCKHDPELLAKLEEVRSRINVATT